MKTRLAFLRKSADKIEVGRLAARHVESGRPVECRVEGGRLAGASSSNLSPPSPPCCVLCVVRALEPA
jgi:hypothetical protein